MGSFGSTALPICVALLGDARQVSGAGMCGRYGHHGCQLKAAAAFHPRLTSLRLVFRNDSSAYAAALSRSSVSGAWLTRSIRDASDAVGTTAPPSGQVKRLVHSARLSWTGKANVKQGSQDYRGSRYSMEVDPCSSDQGKRACCQTRRCSGSGMAAGVRRVVSG